MGSLAQGCREVVDIAASGLKRQGEEDHDKGDTDSIARERHQQARTQDGAHDRSQGDRTGNDRHDLTAQKIRAGAGRRGHADHEV